MDRLLRFSDYDLFAYVASGLAIMLLWDLIFSTHWIIGARWLIGEGVAIILIAYIIGQATAWPAAWLLERQLVRRFLDAPANVLFLETQPTSSFKRRLFPDFFTPLDPVIREAVEHKAGQNKNSDLRGQSLFWVAFARVKRDPSTYSRMEAFLKLYGFCRNISFVAFVGSIALAINFFWQELANSKAAALSRLQWASFALLIAVTMFYRYLKFLRLYNVEVFVGYSELSNPKEEQNAN